MIGARVAAGVSSRGSAAAAISPTPAPAAGRRGEIEVLTGPCVAAARNYLQGEQRIIMSGAQARAAHQLLTRPDTTSPETTLKQRIILTRGADGRELLARSDPEAEAAAATRRSSATEHGGATPLQRMQDRAVADDKAARVTTRGGRAMAPRALRRRHRDVHGAVHRL